MQDKLLQNLVNYEKALVSLETNILKIQGMDENAEDYDIYRDSTIQRFEYTMESAKKLMANYIEFVDQKVAGQQQIIKKAFEFDLIDDDVWFQMLEDRNNTSHEYDENIAKELVERIYTHAIKLRIFHDTIKPMIEAL
ncbi:HI0074 family nucleotidyltransferase substrate-binding subunit [Sulfuricurvum sp.]|uniref:HI0074 family nucleotidyltransferase substrate-binding subunit n=1 Tax=Sulfuricurvum sp. TaxID=2025608 RepID=UPI00263270F1|nr:HI0074 family nucleotidyltransferase substrate-binding subunit [Sulfuricurvum sp.]MDD3597458.1 HI0074 family nucleotidyltransferase substrate-binding subunit [Sulfuricurvum sp.]